MHWETNTANAAIFPVVVYILQKHCQAMNTVQSLTQSLPDYACFQMFDNSSCSPCNINDRKGVRKRVELLLLSSTNSKQNSGLSKYFPVEVCLIMKWNVKQKMLKSQCFFFFEKLFIYSVTSFYYDLISKNTQYM